MKLQTNIPLQKASSLIQYSSNLMLLGSCFAEHISNKLDYYRFTSLSNPFGILFHPRAIENLIERALEKRYYTAAEVFQYNEKWQCFDTHSDLSSADAQSTIRLLNEAIESTNSFFTKATKDKQIPSSPRLRRTSNKSTHLIITLGTAWVYRLKKTGQIVANCHKVPQREFSKELLSVKEIVESLENIIKIVQKVNNDAVFIFTVSPVRHLKDGFVENTRSKSHLISAVHQLTDGERIFYFPSYELMMDELRDYRYYDRDMIHPNDTAIDYIWDKFKEVWIDDKDYAVMEKVEQIQKGLLHKPFNPDSEQHQQFIAGLEEKIKDLQATHPFMKFN